MSKATAWLRSKFLGVEGYFATIVRSLRSKTVLSAAAGFGVHYAVKKNYIPDAFFTSALEGVAFVLCAIFRVSATHDVKTGEPLTPLPPITDPTTPKFVA